MKPLSHQRCSGLSIVELMVAMALSLLLIAGVASLFVSSKKSYTESERFARLQENARFAMFSLEQELRLVRFFGSVRSTSISKDGALGTVGNDCRDANGKGGYDSDPALTGTDADGSGAAYGCINDAVPGTSVLMIKHVRPRPLDPASAEIENNKTYVLANHDIGKLYEGADPAPVSQVPSYTGTGGADQNVPAQSWEYQDNVYYIRNSNPPNLSRMTLQAGAMVREDLISGIERMVLMFGVDSDRNGDIDTFVSSATLNAATAYGWEDVGAVQVTLLVRGDEVDTFFTDNKTYNLGSDVTVTNPNDNYHRMVIRSTLGLRNPLFVIKEDGS